MATSTLLLNKSKSAAAAMNSGSKEIENMRDMFVKCGNELKNQSSLLLTRTLMTSCLGSSNASSASSSLSSSSSSGSSLGTSKSLCGYESTSQTASLILNTPTPKFSNSDHLASSSSSSCPFRSAFIDPSELIKSLYEMSKRRLIILLDCRSYNEFNTKTIVDSVHLNCRDKLIKKRLQNQKITVKDLISCESTKSKFENQAAATTMTTTTTPTTTESTAAAKISLNNLEISNRALENLNKNLQQQQQQQNETDKDGNIIVLYDDTTSDVNDLLVESNPLKIVQENIEKAGFNKECKILKGGFKQFFEMCPELCSSKSELKNNLCNSHYYEQQADQQQHSIDNAVMTEITPFLYLGNELDAKNTEKLAHQGIYHILNVTKNIPFYEDHQPVCVSSSSSSSSSLSKFVYKRIPVNDSINQNLREYFDEAIDFIDEAKKANSKVLVHCQAGVSRSPTVVIAYVMKKYNLNLNEAYGKVREMRPIIAPNLIFMSQLMEFESKLKSSQVKEAAAAVQSSSSSTSFMNAFNFTTERSVDDDETLTTTNANTNKTPIECN